MGRAVVVEELVGEECLELPFVLGAPVPAAAPVGRRRECGRRRRRHRRRECAGGRGGV
jgi:hypothetical protein